MQGVGDDLASQCVSAAQVGLMCPSSFGAGEKQKNVAQCVAQSPGERGRKAANRGERQRLKAKGIDGNRSFRNRQVVGSTPTLGSILHMQIPPIQLFDSAIFCMR